VNNFVQLRDKRWFPSSHSGYAYGIIVVRLGFPILCASVGAMQLVNRLATLKKVARRLELFLPLS
jgi:hypothetical protein